MKDAEFVRGVLGDDRFGWGQMKYLPDCKEGTR